MRGYEHDVDRPNAAARRRHPPPCRGVARAAGANQFGENALQYVAGD